jgi:putative phage-type endonuclease
VTERDDWLAWRRKGIGASDVAGILGISPWASPYSVWVDKTVGGDDSDSEAMEAGRMLEPAIGPWFEQRTGLYVAAQQERCTHPMERWARATLDGTVYDHRHVSPVIVKAWDVVEYEACCADVPLGGLEIKTTSDAPKKWDDAIPTMYQAQAQFQMWVTGMERTWFAVLHANWGLRLRLYELPRDDEDIATIVARCERFWFDHVVAGQPPAVDGHDATTEALRRVEVEPSAGLIVDDVVRRTVADLRTVREQIKVLEDVEATYANELRSALGEHHVGYVDAGGRLQPVVSWKPQDARRIDTTALRARLPRVAERFTNTTTSRVLRLHTPKEK